MKQRLITIILLFVFLHAGCSGKTEAQLLCYPPVEPIPLIMSRQQKILVGNRYSSEYSFTAANQNRIETIYLFASPFSAYTVNEKGFVPYHLSNENRGVICRTDENYMIYPNDMSQEFILGNATQEYGLTLMSRNDIRASVHADDKHTVPIAEYKGEFTNSICAPTISGFQIMLNQVSANDLSSLAIRVRAEDTSWSLEPGGYVLFQKEGNIQAILEPPVLYDGDAIQAASLVPHEKDGEIVFKIEHFSLSEQTGNLHIQFNLYDNKIILDSAVSQAHPELNAYLSNVAMVGEEGTENASRLYLRLNLGGLYPINSAQIDCVEYVVRPLNKMTDMSFALHLVQEDWCSWTICWNNQPQFNSEAIPGEFDEAGWIHFNITDYVKQCLEKKNSKLERFGFVLTGKETGGNAAVLATSDNSSAVPYLKVRLAG